MIQSNLNDIIEATLGLIFDELCAEYEDFDEGVVELEFDNYEELVDGVWNVCPYIKFESIIELWDKWLKSLAE